MCFSPFLVHNILASLLVVCIMQGELTICPRMEIVPFICADVLKGIAAQTKTHNHASFLTFFIIDSNMG